MALTPLVAIVGRPNVGKSTLFNRLAGSRQAITADTAGTTRDAVYAPVNWGKHNFLLVDTAGLEKAEGELGSKVQDQVTSISKVAQTLIVVVDATTMIAEPDRQAATMALKSGRPVVLAINKIDAAGKGLGDNFVRLGIKTMIEVSALHGRGSGDLLDAVAAATEAAPAPKEDPDIKVALLGRPNVGKSSLFNKLADKQQAIVSEVAGTTRDVNRLVLKSHGQAITLLDTAGLVRPGKIKPGVEKFSTLRTLTAIAEADIALLLMDAEEPGVARDQHIAGLAVDAGKGLILAINKWDKLEKDDSTPVRISRRIQREFQFCWWAPLVFASATTGQNVAKLLELILSVDQHRRVQLPTSELNRWLAQAVGKQPPAGLKGKQPKLNYITQTGNQPPQFTIFGAHTGLVHFSYQRYLENQLREQADFSGTPIQLEFRDKRVNLK